MLAAQTARIAFLALIFSVAAFVLPSNTWAASGNVQVCQPNSSCQVGEFLYDDEYAPITSASCAITSRYPDGTVFLNSQAMTASAQNDGWYYKDFTTPATTGLYRTQVCCTSGSDYLCLDKTFEAKTESSSTDPEDVATAVWNADKSAHSNSGSFGEALQHNVPSSSDIASATWNYSGRSLSTFGTLTSDIWGYSTRNLTDFGDLVDNIWGNDERNLTDATLDSGSLAKQSDVTGSTTINNISAGVAETNQMLEMLLKKPVIENSLENGETTFNLESKIDSTQKTAQVLDSKLKYIKSKSLLLDSKWDSFSNAQISKTLSDISYSIGSDKDVTNKSSVLGASVWIGEQWGWQESGTVISQSKILKTKTEALQKEIESKGKSAKSKKEIKAIIVLAEKIQSLLGTNIPASKSKTVYSRIGEVKTIAKTYDSKTLELSGIYGSISTGANGNFEKQVDQLAKDIAGLNFIPKLQKNILAKAETGDKGFKNKILALIGMIDANKQLLAKKPEDTSSSTWLELGSIVFKTLITNPSVKISQEVPVKFYLPSEIKRENILEIDESLTVNFDSEKNQYFVSGNYELKPTESKTLSIKVDDAVFAFNEEEIEGWKKQAEDLSKPLEGTSYFAQGVTLKSDIDVSLNKVLSLQKSANTPEEKIRAYREGKIEVEDVKVKMEKLKELATSAGSAGTLYGFVGGAQVLAVWALVIILIAGFVFLALYMKLIRGGTFLKKKKAKREEEEVEFEEPKLSRGHKGFKLAAIAVISLVLVGLGGGAVMNLRSSQLAKQQSEEKIASVDSSEQAVLGEKTTEEQPEIKGEEVSIFVPAGSIVNVYKEANLDSDVISGLDQSRKVIKMNIHDSWVKIGIEGSEKVIGWIDADFVEINVPVSLQVSAPQTASAALKMITISDTPTGFLRVRSAPGGKELSKLDPGKKYPVLDTKNGWLNILLDDGSLGWISGKYTDYKETMAMGGQIAP